MDLSIIIVSYNSADLICGCLDSILSAGCAETEIFVVDNASTDGSTSLIKENYPAVHLTENPANRGFAAANNQVLQRCRGRYVLFLNPDTKVMPDTFRNALSFMDANPSIGLAGTKIVNLDGSPQDSVSYRYPGQKYAKRESLPTIGAIACVLGASMIARREILLDVGGFDEDFFLYGEDQDLCLRIRRKGFEIGYIESALVIHLGGRSERETASTEVWKKKILAEAVFYRKHYLPETIDSIRKANLREAAFRLAILKLAVPFLGDKTQARAKLAKYETFYALHQRLITGG